MATVIHYSEKNRFVAEESGVEAAHLEYEVLDGGKTLAATHTVTEDEFRGRGIASELVAALFEHASRENVTIRPVCPYVVKWVEKNPQVQDLVAK